MTSSDLGLFKDYGHIIIPICIMFYMGTYLFLARDYGYIDDEDYYESRD